MDYLIQFTPDIRLNKEVGNIPADTMSRSISAFLLDTSTEYKSFVEEQAKHPQLQLFLFNIPLSLKICVPIGKL